MGGWNNITPVTENDISNHWSDTQPQAAILKEINKIASYLSPMTQTGATSDKVFNTLGTLTHTILHHTCPNFHAT